MNRRLFLGATSAAGIGLATSARGACTPATLDSAGTSASVNLLADGLAPSPAEYLRALQARVSDPSFAADQYSLGGEIARLEQAFAARLGKEAAVFLPTGTLANHLAVRLLAGADRRVIVQADSHLYCDSGDAATTLSGLNLIPAGASESGITAKEIAGIVQATGTGRVAQRVGAISIESPIRRRDHGYVDPEEIDAVVALARREGIRLHLDGARLFNLPHHSGRSVIDWAKPFDTVYVSVWKLFNGLSGAILAGSRELLDGLYHQRRMFGGSLPQAWPMVATTLAYLPEYERDYARAWQVADELFARLRDSGHFQFRQLPRGTSRVWMTATRAAPTDFVAKVRAQGIDLPERRADSGEWSLTINTSLLRMSGEQMAAILIREAQERAT